MTALIQPIEFPVDGLTLRGMHYRPEGPAPHPTAVLFHGFGASRVETTGLFVTLARALVEAGIAVIAVDRAGQGESDGDFIDTTASRDIAHSHTVLAAVSAHPDVDEANLHFVGMSLGAVISSVVAAETARRIRSLTMWSTAAVFVDEIRSGRLQGRPLDPLDTVGYVDFLGMRVGPAMRADAVTFDVYGRAAGYRGPVLLLHGTEDFVPVASARRYTDPDVFGDRAELVVIDGADHGWAELPPRDEVIARTVAFIVAHAGLRDEENTAEC